MMTAVEMVVKSKSFVKFHFWNILVFYMINSQDGDDRGLMKSIWMWGISTFSVNTDDSLAVI